MDYFELIRSRESCRNFSSQPVEKEKLVACIEAARIAPSACNSQPWGFIVVNNRELSPKVAKCVQRLRMNQFASHCPAFIVVTENEPVLTRAASAIVNQKFAPIDIGLAVMQLCLAASAQGLSTCIMGWLSEKHLKELRDIPESRHVRLVIAVGYAEEGTQLRPKVRKDLEEIARFID